MAKAKIGEKVFITDRESWAFGEWGIVKLIDSDGLYHVAIANDERQSLLFDVSQIRRRNSKRK